MAILRLQHIGLAVSDLKEACERFETLFGLTARDYRNDQGSGMQLDARILLGNGCWLHLVQNWNPEARANQFLSKYGPGLEHIAIETNSIEEDVAHLRELGVPVYMDKIFNAPDGFEAFIYPDQTLAMTVELIQPHVTSWGYPDDGGIVSKTMGIKQLQHSGVAVRNTNAAAERFQQLFGLNSTDGRLPFKNDCWLQFLSGDQAGSSVTKFLDKNGPGIEYVALATTTFAADVVKLDAAGAATIKENAVWIDGAHVAGTTVELVSAAA